MRESSTTLAAADVRAALFAALEPVRAICEAFLAFEPARRSALRYAVQLHPLVIQVVLVPAEGSPRCMAAFSAAHLPDGGAGLRAAVEAFAAGGLAGLSGSAFENAVVNAAASDNGGLFVYVDPTDETAVLSLALPGRSLGEAVWLAALMDAPPTAH